MEEELVPWIKRRISESLGASVQELLKAQGLHWSYVADVRILGLGYPCATYFKASHAYGWLENFFWEGMAFPCSCEQ